MQLNKVRNSALINVAGWILPTAIFLVLTPIMIHYLGNDGFGVITIIQILTGYMTILNFGFSEAIIKQVAESRNVNDDLVMRTLWSALALFIAAGTLGAAAIYLATDWLINDILTIPDNLKADAASALRIGALVFLLQMIAEFYRGASIGFHRFDIPSISRIVRVALSGIFIYIALRDGGGLASVMMATLAGLLIGLVLNMVWMQRHMPMHWVGGSHKETIREMLHFGKHIFLSRIANMFSSKINQLFLGSLSNVANVALYSVPVRAAEAGATVLNKLLQVFFPGFSAMDKQQDARRIRNLYFSIISIQLFITSPLLVGVILEGPAALAVWINKDFASQAGIIINIVAVTYYLSSLTNLPTYTAMSYNQPVLISRYSIYRVIIVGLTVYPLVKYFGMTGAAWVVFLSELPGILFMQEATRKSIGESFYGEMLAPIAKHVAIGFVLILAYELFYRHSNWYHPAAAFLVILLHMLAATATGALNTTDRNRLMRLVKVW